MEVCGKKIQFRGKLVRLAYLDAEGCKFLEDPEAVVASLRKLRPDTDLFTFIQRLSNRSPEYNYPVEWDNLAVLPISTFDDWMNRQVHAKVRTKVRKAKKRGVSVREVPFDDALIRGIHAIYNESPIRQGSPFRHYGKDLEAVRNMTATYLDQSIFISAFLDGEMIGFVKIVVGENLTQARTMHVISMIHHRDKSPTNALIAHAVQVCAQRGIPYLSYGKFSYGKRRTDSLAEFKRHNGFQKVEIPRYYVPLTRAGHVALRLGLHHRLIEWIPGPAVIQYRRIRKFWYGWRYSGFKDAY